MKNRPIGVFDSGVGGLSVLHEARRILPRENFLYYGDNIHAPYGMKSPEDILLLTLNAADFLLKKGVKALLVACNTATSVAINRLRSENDMPVISMEPAVKPALRFLSGGKVLVLATPATLSQGRYLRLIEKIGGTDCVINLPCPGLAELVETHDFEAPEIYDYLHNAFAPIAKEPVQAIVLGCTHYVFLRHAVTQAAGAYWNGLPVLDGHMGTALHLKHVLERRGLLKLCGTGSAEYYSSGDVRVFERFISSSVQKS
ncbi:MAG: glutamate racemase [Christensenellales bacterium]|jgi:glutamate racemase